MPSASILRQPAIPPSDIEARPLVRLQSWGAFTSGRRSQPEAAVDFAKCWYCGPPALYPVVMALVLLGVGLFAWKALRPPRPPNWWRKSR
jgi:hypothetical protein